MDFLSSIGIIILIMLVFSIPGLSIIIPIILFNILWHYIETSMIKLLGSDAQIFYWVGIVLLFLLTIAYFDNASKNSTKTSDIKKQ
jgi:hypothetical protein